MNFAKLALLASSMPSAVIASPQASMPRAVQRGGPRADSGNPSEVLSELSRAFGEFTARNDSRMSEIEAALDATNTRQASAMLGGSTLGLSDGLASDPNYAGLFASYFRKGGSSEEHDLAAANRDGDRGAIQAAMSVGTNSDGGFLAPVEWDRAIRKRLRVLSPMRQIAQVQSTSVGAYSTIWNNDVWGTGWVGETAVRPETTSATLSQLTFDSGELYAMPAATQRLLDDSAINVEDWVAESVEDEFARQEGIAFISGSGTNKPRGLLTYVPGGVSDGHHPGGNLSIFNSESADSIPGPDTLLNFKYSLSAPYRQNARWLMNSLTAAYIAKMKDNEGRYIWREGLLEGEPSTLLGRPVTIDEGMPNIGADAFPIAFGDFSAGYLVNDRIGTRILRDPYTNKPFVLFYTTKRVGGGVLDPNAIVLLKVAVTA